MRSLLTIKGDFLFQFDCFHDWVNNAAERYSPYQYGYSKIALDRNNNVCHIGEDFMFARDNQLFPVKVYSLERSVNSVISTENINKDL